MKSTLFIVMPAFFLSLVVSLSPRASFATVIPVASNQVLHLDASAINTGDVNQVSAGKVANWLDTSPQSNDAGQTDANFRPTYVSNGGAAFNNKPVVQFGGGITFVEVSSLAAYPYSYNNAPFAGLTNQAGATVFMVFNTTTSPAGNQVALESLTSTGTTSYPRVQIAANKFYTGANANAVTFGNAVPVQNTPYLFSSTFNGTLPDAAKLSLAINGTAQILSPPAGTPDATTSDITRMILGVYHDASFGLTGNIAEVVVFNRVLTAAEYNQVGYALAQSYGLSTAFVAPAAEAAPEPGSFALVLLGALGLWRAKRKQACR